MSYENMTLSQKREFHTDNALKLIGAIERSERLYFKQLLHSPELINWTYVNAEGNTLLHLACGILRYYDAGAKSYYGEPILRHMGIGSLSIRNNARQLPHDLLGGEARLRNLLYDQYLVYWTGSLEDLLHKERLRRQRREIALYKGKMIGGKPYPGVYFVENLALRYDRLAYPYQCDVPDSHFVFNTIDR